MEEKNHKRDVQRYVNTYSIPEHQFHCFIYMFNIYKTISTLHWREEPQQNYKRKMKILSTQQDMATFFFYHQESIGSSIAIEETSQTLKAT